LELLGDKIRLRPIEKPDIDDLYNWWNDPQFAGEYAGDYPKSRAEVEELVRGAWFFLIESCLEDKKVGFISYYYPVRSDYLYLYEIGYNKAE
jgi:RimJ/RimL family protein N-acetyltransferase